MSIKRRPTGVSILAVLGFANVAVYLVLLAMAIFLPDILRFTLEGLSPQGAGPSALLNLGPALAVYFAGMAVVIGLVAYGMWTLRNWARWIIILIAGLSLIGTISENLSVTELDLSSVAFVLVRIGLSVLILGYLWLPSVRSAFQSTRRADITAVPVI